MTSTLAKICSAASACLIAGSAAAKVRMKDIEYKQGDTVLRGSLAWDDAVKGKRPGVLVIHEWWGLNEHARAQAKRLAKVGYVAFALDMYGKGKVAAPTHPKDAMAFMQEASRDPDVLTARFDAAYRLLQEQPQVDPARIAAFGYCFGGGVALNMARAGKDLAAVVTFHGSLKPYHGPAQPGTVKPPILVLTGADDPMINKEQVEGFEKEMKDAGANVKVVTYPGARHGFTNPDAGKAGMEGLAYNAQADKESWAAAMAFLKQVFGS
ncbi:MAG TPA: dienelactone hydrolase family protein [Anaeromyxobacter sp.]|nr:dienelactone hydrolase family protein [Anaeromyxobacter sp.]